MQKARVIPFPRNRSKQKKKAKGSRLNVGKKGRVFSRGGRLWVDFYYLGKRVREPSGLKHSESNRLKLRRKLDLIVAEIENGAFEFQKRFPQSSKKEEFTQLEGRTVRKSPQEILFGDYVSKWWKEMASGMSENQIRDYTCSLKNHLLPYFSDVPLSEFKPVLMKKFLASLKAKKNRYQVPLSAKTIVNYLGPLRQIVADAVDEYGWDEFKDPFRGVKLPRPIKKRIQPLSYAEWLLVREHLSYWYRPYFEFAVQTGLRPSEQVALKWSAIDSRFIYIEQSRVRKREKADLKTEGSFRTIELRAHMKKTLECQKELTQRFETPYVFVNSKGGCIQQENLGKVWRRALLSAGISYRRMYETRHTFASWALAAGESSEWVAKTLGHVDTTMVYRVYGRYIPNLTRKDGSAFEREFARATSRQADSGVFFNANGHNFGHNG